MAADYVNAEGKKERKKKVITDCSVIQVVIRAQSDRSLGLKPMLAVPGSGLSWAELIDWAQSDRWVACQCWARGGTQLKLATWLLDHLWLLLVVERNGNGCEMFDRNWHYHNNWGLSSRQSLLTPIYKLIHSFFVLLTWEHCRQHWYRLLSRIYEQRKKERAIVTQSEVACCQ